MFDLKIMDESKNFTITRESVGFSPLIVTPNLKNINHTIKNCSFRLKECQQFLDLTIPQIKSGIRIDILKAVSIMDVIYISIDSILKVKEDKELKELILDEDTITTFGASELLKISTVKIRKLIDEGYLTVIGTYEFKYGIGNYLKRGEVRKLKFQMSEINEFWKQKTKINRKIGAIKATKSKQEKSQDISNFREEFYQRIENLPHKQSGLIKGCVFGLALNYYINRKLKKNIVDKELLDLRTKFFKKLITIYKDTEYLNIFFVKGNLYIEYCPECIKNFEKTKFRPDNLNFAHKTCKNCKTDEFYYSTILLYIEIFEYTFILNIPYKDLGDWFFKENIFYERLPIEYKHDKEKALIDDVEISSNYLKTFKLYEITNYLNEFVSKSDFAL